MLPRGFTSQCFDAADTTCHRTFGDDRHQGNVAKRVDVGTAAKLNRIIGTAGVTHAKNADFIAIFLAKECECACRHCLIGGHQARGHCGVTANLRVHFRFDIRNFLGRHRLVVREVETQAIGCHKAALLRHMAAKAVTQCGMQQVRGAMV